MNKGLVLANGVFDTLHPGHVRFLRKARSFGDRLTVAINTDRSVREIKGPERPIICQHDRMEMLMSLRCVDDVVIFDEPDPLRIIKILKPEVLVKGEPWTRDTIIGAKEVESWGGRVVVLPLEPGYSSTALIERIRNCNVAPGREK